MAHADSESPEQPGPHEDGPEGLGAGWKSYALHPVSVPGMFEGPLDLLLTLIEQEELDVSQVSLATVTEQYLDRLKQLTDVSPEHLADFLVVAATLLLIKSKRLFPDLSLTDEEERHMASLEEQLQEYRKFRAAAKEVIRLSERGCRQHARAAFLSVSPVFSPPPDFGVAHLQWALSSVLEVLPRFEVLTAEVVRRVISLEDRIREIQERIQSRASLVFREVVEGAANRLEIIVSFLALLELVKQRVVAAEQQGAFHEIFLSRHGGFKKMES